jgi:hypothetical protein
MTLKLKNNYTSQVVISGLNRFSIAPLSTVDAPIGFSEKEIIEAITPFKDIILLGGTSMTIHTYDTDANNIADDADTVTSVATQVASDAVTVHETAFAHADIFHSNRAVLDNIIAIPVTKSLYVDRNREDAYTADGTEAKPFKTIQEAVDTIAALNVAEYLTVFIKSGIYRENVVLENEGIQYIKFQGVGYVSINPTSGNSFQSTINNDNLKALYVSDIGFAKPVVLTGANGANSFVDVILSNTSFTGTATLNATCINNLTFRQVYSECNFTYTNVNWSYFEGGQIQGDFLFTMDDTLAVPSWGKDGSMLANGINLSGGATYTIGGTATYTPAVTGSRWGSNQATTIPAGVTLYAYNSFVRGSITNNGGLHLRCSTVDSYVGGTGTLNLDAQPASLFKNDSSVSGASVKDALDNCVAKNSISGTFTTVDGKTITVVNGQITNII